MPSQPHRNDPTTTEGESSLSTPWLLARGGVRAAVVLIAIQSVSLASAHGGTVRIVQWASLLPLGVGISLIAGSVALNRVLDTNRSRYAFYGVTIGIVFAVAGAIGLVQLSQIRTFSASQSPIAESLYEPLTLLAGLAIMIASVVVGRLRWPSQPRYAGLGILLGLWVGYPAFTDALGLYGPTNPLGYVIVLALPLGLGYVLWRDARGLIADLFADRLARRFGVGMGLLASVFFLFSSGLLSFTIDDGVGLSWSHGFITTTPVLDPLVLWPAVEFFVPRLPFITPVLQVVLPPDLFPTPPYIPFRGALSPGILILVGTLGTLVGLNAAVLAYFWQGDAADADTSDTTTGALTGAVAVTAPNVCCCCGPVLAEFAAVLLGPSAAMPFYWLFVDLSSPVGAVFLAMTILVLTGNFVRATRMNRSLGACTVETSSIDTDPSATD